LVFGTDNCINAISAPKNGRLVGINGNISMTMTAAFCVESYPVLVGDILLSGLEVLGKEVHIPTIGNIDSVFPEGSGFSIVGLCQKLCIVNDRIAIGWAGKRFSARYNPKLWTE